MSEHTVSMWIHRSQEWLLAERLRTGRNVPEEIKIEVDPATLTEDARKLWLLCGHGFYSPFYKVGYYTTYELACNYVGYGSVNIQVDAESPAPAQISAAIVAAVAAVATKRGEAERLAAEEAERKAISAAAAAEMEWKKTQARELLAEEIAKLTKERDYYKTECNRAQIALDELQEENEEVDA